MDKTKKYSTGKETYLIGEFVNLGEGSLLGESSDLFRL